MLVTVAVTMCHFLITLPSPVCEEMIVTDSDKSEGLTWIGCVALGQAPLAKWKQENKIYRSPDYFIGGYKCVAGHYEVKRRA